MTFAQAEHSSSTLTPYPRCPHVSPRHVLKPLKMWAFLSGAALNHLHLVLGREEVPKPCCGIGWRCELAEACVGFSGRPERAPELRDAVHLLRPGDLPRPTGETYLAWRSPLWNGRCRFKAFEPTFTDLRGVARSPRGWMPGRERWSAARQWCWRRY